MDALPQTDKLIREGIAQGLHPGAQVCVWRGAECVVNAAFGEARPGVTMTADTMTLWLSSCKPITAIALAKQVEAGVVHLEDPVAEYVEGFEQNGKQDITLHHVLTHTGGFRSVVFRYPGQTWDEAIDAICGARFETGWVLGETAGYHPHSGWNILGKVLEVCTGQTLRDHLREAVLLPLGMNDSYVGLPPEGYDAHEPRLASTLNTSGSTPVDQNFNTPEWSTGQRPGGNAFGPAHELARLYRAMLNGGSFDGTSLVTPDSVRHFTTRHRRDTMDRTFRAVMDWGLGFMVNNQRHDAANAETHKIATPYNFGPHASDDAFGHCGNQSSAAFADPAHDLAVAVVFNGMPGEPKHQQRMHAVLGAIYEDLGLVSD